MPRPMDIIDPKKDLDKVEEKDFDLSDHKKGESKDEFEIEQSKGSGIFYLVLGIIALVVATGFALYVLYRDDGKGGPKTAKATPTATASAQTSATQTSTASTVASVSETSTTIGIGSPSQTKISYSSSSVRIANGNGKTGEASRIKTLLEGKGFSITSVGNATKTYDETTIFYKQGKSELANALVAALKGEYSATTKESSETVGSYDAVVALGTK